MLWICKLVNSTRFTFYLRTNWCHEKNQLSWTAWSTHYGHRSLHGNYRLINHVKRHNFESKLMTKPCYLGGTLGAGNEKFPFAKNFNYRQTYTAARGSLANEVPLTRWKVLFLQYFQKSFFFYECKLFLIKLYHQELKLWWTKSPWMDLEKT